MSTRFQRAEIIICVYYLRLLVLKFVHSWEEITHPILLGNLPNVKKEYEFLKNLVENCDN